MCTMGVLLGERFQPEKQPLSGMTRPDPQEQRGWSDGARGPGAKALQAGGGWPERRASCKVPGPGESQSQCTISQGPVRPGRAGQAGGWVPAFLPISPASSPAPTWAEQRGGGCVAGAEAACAVRGVGVPAGWPRPPGPLPPRRGPGSILRATSAGRRRSGDPDLPTQWVGHGGNRPATPPRATPRRHPVGSPPPP